MPSTILDSAVFRDIFTTPAMREVWSDENRVQKYLDFEAALARAQGRLGIIPKSRRRDSAPLLGRQDRHGQAQGGDRAHRLSGAAGGPAAGQAVQGHTRRMVALGRHHPGYHRHRHRPANPRVARHRREGNRRYRDALAKLAKKYRDTPMAGRSNLQQAVPITFGYKMATLLGRLRAPQAAPQGAACARAGGRIRRRRRHVVLARQRRAEVPGRTDEGTQAPPARYFLAHRARPNRRGRLLPRAGHRHLRKDRLRRETVDADRSGRSLRAVPRGPRFVLDHAAKAQPDLVGLHHRAGRHGEAAHRCAARSYGRRPRTLHRPVGNRMDRAAGHLHAVGRRAGADALFGRTACRSTKRRCAKTSTSPKV